MKRFLVPLIVAVALALPAQAIAGTKSYSGNVSPSGTIALKVKKKHGKSSLRRVDFDQVPMSCDQGHATTSGFLTGKFKLKHKQFHISGDNGQGSNLDIEGTVSSGGSSGTIQLFGSVPVDPVAAGNVGSNCDTGVLSWTAAA